MTSMPASRSARAITLAPRSWPSRPGLATRTRIFRSVLLSSMQPYLSTTAPDSPRRHGASNEFNFFTKHTGAGIVGTETGAYSHQYEIPKNREIPAGSWDRSHVRVREGFAGPEMAGIDSTSEA